jgi:hypothetical protein
MHVRYTRLFTDPSGASRFENKESQLQLGFAAPPAEPLYSGPLTPALEAFWMGAPPTWKGEKPHPAPRRMVFVTVEGEYQIDASGEVRKFPKGSVLLLENTTGTGHSTKITSAENAIVLAVGLPAA